MEVKYHYEILGNTYYTDGSINWDHAEVVEVEASDEREAQLIARQRGISIVVECINTDLEIAS
jgi:hypothetical protein